MLTSYACGHVGRMNDGGPRGPRSKTRVKAFIRVAEVRGRKVDTSRKQCPDCVKVSD